MRVHVVYEGHSDLPFVERLVTHAGGEICGRYNKKGAGNLDRNIDAYIQAASRSHGDVWLVVRDSDRECPVQLRNRLLQRFCTANSCPDSFLLRIAHPMIEEWMLADYRGAVEFFRLPEKAVRKAHDNEHPKRALLQAVHEHGTKHMKQRLVRNNGEPGPEFVAVYREFAEKWDVGNAMANSDSLRRAHAALVRAKSLATYP